MSDTDQNAQTEVDQDVRAHSEAPAEGGTAGDTATTDERAHSEAPAEG